MKLCGLISVGAILGIILSAPGPAIAEPHLWKPGDAPPVVNGLKLGDSEQRALDLLGVPDEVNPTTNGELLEYRTKGIEVTATTKEGVTAIRLLSPEAGTIDGIRVGDIARNVVLRWGAPQMGTGRVAHFGTRDWIISVHLADKESTIVDLTLALNRASPAPDSSTLNVFQTQ